MDPERACGTKAAGCLAATALLLAACAATPAEPTTPAAPSAVLVAQGAGATASTQTFTSPYAYEWFIRAEVLRARGALEQAISAYQSALTSVDDDPFVLARLATALDEHGERAAAEAALNDALAQDPRSEAAWLARADIAQRHGELDAALGGYERAEAAAPASPRAPLALAQLLRTRGDVERAIAVLARFEARTLPGSAGAAQAALELALDRSDGSAAYAAAQALAQLRSGARDGLLRTAHSLLDAGKPLLAERVLQAVPAQPEDAALRLRVLLACQRDQTVEALLTVTDPAAVGGLVPVAEAYLAVQRPEQALELANAARAQAPDDARVALVHARASLALGRYTEAASALARLLQTDPTNQSARSNLASALQAGGLTELAAELTHATETAAETAHEPAAQ